MTLRFDFTEKDAIALSERFLRCSKAHQKARLQIRLVPPLVFVLVGGFLWRTEGSPAALILFAAMAVAWWFYYGRRSDANVRAHMKKLMAESSYAKAFGSCELQLFDQHMVSISPLGVSTCNWAGVTKVEMDDEYLFSFLSGPQGYSIPISQVGQEAAQKARGFVAERIASSVPSPLPAAA